MDCAQWRRRGACATTPPMDDAADKANGADGAQALASTPYDRAVAGFKNYWYPALGEREVGRHPKRMILLGEPIAFVRRGRKVYAVQDECPHRGARMSLGKDEFPGTDTLACRFHGWTFDLRNGACVAALTDGPDSPVVGKVRIRTFPTEQRKGIVWVWMGRGAPVPLEEDIPKLLLREDTLVKHRRRVVYGNWRYHAESGDGGHFQMLHRDSLVQLTNRFFAHLKDYAPVLTDEEGDDGPPYLVERTGGLARQAAYPGLGEWPPNRPWRFASQPYGRSVHGVSTIAAVRLPGLLRINHFPVVGALYYEWYVPIRDDAYVYFQASCHWPRNPLSRLITRLKWHAYWGPMKMGRFNDQDKAMVRDSTDLAKRRGHHSPTPLYRPDRYPLDWIAYANERARGAAREG